MIILISVSVILEQPGRLVQVEQSRPGMNLLDWSVPEGQSDRLFSTPCELLANRHRFHNDYGMTK
jgi:hypothetical protein